MKNKLLKAIIMLSKCFLYGLVLQTLLLNLVLALNANGQYKNIEEVRVRLSAEQLSLDQFFKEVQRQTPFKFSYEYRDVDRQQSVTFAKREGLVIDFLREAAQQTQLSFRQVNHGIDVLKKKHSEVEVIAAVNPITISGTVMDENGEPLPGATISVQGTSTGTATDLDGKYSLDVPEGVTLVFSYIGYETQQVTVGNQTTINISLKQDESSLDEVVVVGYGTAKKETITGSVASVRGEEIAVAPVSSTSQLLVGRLPGLITKQTSGEPGADAAALRIRGFGNALVIVDGVQGVDINTLDVNQIESVSILKDGAASIYGARAGNGVILITTKRGVSGKPTISLNTSYGVQGVTRLIRPASSGQRAEMEREAHLNQGLTPETAPWTEEAIDHFYAQDQPEKYPNTDWYEYAFRPWAPQQNHNLSIRGGSEKIKYFGLAGITDQKTLVRRNGGGYSRFNAQSNIDADITDDLKMTVDLSLAYENSEGPRRARFGGEYYESKPWFPAELPDPDKISYAGNIFGNIAAVNNTELLGYNRSNDRNFRGQTTFTYDLHRILKGLKAKAFLNYSDGDGFGKGFEKPQDFYTYNPDNQQYTHVASSRFNSIAMFTNRYTEFTQQYSLSYENTFSEIHHLSALALVETIESKSRYFFGGRENLLTSSIDQLFVGDSKTMTNQGSESEMGRMGYVGRLNYSLKDRYLLETIMRTDATAKFPSDTRWGYFPSVSLGWIVSQEGFMKNLKALDHLKLRASYGESGNDAVGNFQYMAGYTTNRTTALLDDEVQPAIYSTGLANPFLTWERMIIYNAGIDFSFGKFYGEGDIFYRERNGIPATRITSLPSTFGSELPPENLNSMDNRGFELRLGTASNTGAISYDVSGNISYSRAKWIHHEEPDFTDPDQKMINQKSGQWDNRVIGYVWEKLFESQEEIDALGYTYDALGGNDGLRPGDVKYKDLNGDGVLDWKDQKVIGAGDFPNWSFGITSAVTYKNFDLSALFQGAFGYNNALNLNRFPNAVQYALRWTQETNDPNALVPRLGGSPSNNWTSDYLYKPVSYIRLKNAALGYTLSEDALNKLGISKVRFYLSGVNLFTISSLDEYLGIDPENAGGGDNTTMSYPQQRTLNVGLNMSF